MGVERLAAVTADSLGLLDVYAFLRRKVTRSQVVILMYHRVSKGEHIWSPEIVSPQAFKRQLEFICRDYEFLSLNGLVHYIREETRLPEKAVVITFDDGYKDNYTCAYPILKKYHAPATIFLTTGHIGTSNLFWWDKVRYIVKQTTVKHLELDELGSYSLVSNEDRSGVGSTIVHKLRNLPERRKNYLIEKLANISAVTIPNDVGKQLVLSWEEVREMSANGIEFGAHSVTHPILTNLPMEEARREISESKEEIERRLGKAVRFFAYPGGNFNSQMVRMVKECGFLAAVALDPPTWIDANINPYELNRIDAARENQSEFKVVFCALWGDLRNILIHRLLGSAGRTSLQTAAPSNDET